MVPPASDRVPRVRPYSGATCVSSASLTGLLPPSADLSRSIQLAYPQSRFGGPQPLLQAVGLASFPFARRYLGNRFFFLFLRVLRCFSSPSSLRIAMYSLYDTYALPYVGSPIRISAGLWICAPHRSFSQLITSFVGSQCQGIPLMLLLT